MHRVAKTAAAAALLAGIAATASAQGPARSPWGGPDSPGGLLGGDPREVMPDAAWPMRHDAVWQFLLRRFDQLDADRDRVLTRQELGIPRGDIDRNFLFRQFDRDRNGGLTPDEMAPLAGRIIDMHDRNGDRMLQQREMRQRAPARS